MTSFGGMKGQLFVYSESHRLVAFISAPEGCSHPTNALVFLGGLTDGLMATQYLPELATGIGKEGWALVQPLLRSSYSAWGTASLKTGTAAPRQPVSAAERAMACAYSSAA